MRWGGGWMMIGVLVVAGAVACSGDGDGDGNPGELYPDRANQYREDQERRIGEPVMIGGYTAAVTDVEVVEGSLRVAMEITNRDEVPQRIDSTQWTLVNPRVQTIEATSAEFPVTELRGGATVAAEVSFAVDPEEAGSYYIQYKPEPLDAARGIWQHVVEPQVTAPDALAAYCETAAALAGERPEAYVGSEQHRADIDRLGRLASPELAAPFAVFNDFLASGAIDPADPDSNLTEHWPEEVRAAVDAIFTFNAANC